MNIFMAAAVAAGTVLAAVTVKKNSPEIALLLSISGAVIIALYALEGISEVIHETEMLADIMRSDYLKIPVKVLGITLMSSVVSKLCENTGDKAIAFTLMTAGRAAVVLCSLPLFSQLMEILAGILRLE